MRDTTSHLLYTFHDVRGMRMHIPESWQNSFAGAIDNLPTTWNNNARWNNSRDMFLFSIHYIHAVFHPGFFGIKYIDIHDECINSPAVEEG